MTVTEVYAVVIPEQTRHRGIGHYVCTLCHPTPLYDLARGRVITALCGVHLRHWSATHICTPTCGHPICLVCEAMMQQPNTRLTYNTHTVFHKE